MGFYRTVVRDAEGKGCMVSDRGYVWVVEVRYNVNDDWWPESLWWDRWAARKEARLWRLSSAIHSVRVRKYVREEKP